MVGAKEEKDWNCAGESLHGRCAGVLISPDRERRILVFYQRNSLSALACVRMHSWSDSHIHHGCVKTERGLAIFCRMEVLVTWPLHEITTISHRLLALLGSFERLIAKAGNHWEFIELCEKTTKKNDCPITGFVFATQVLTFPSRSLVPLSNFECEVVGARDAPSVSTGLQVPPLPVDQLGRPEHFFPRQTACCARRVGNS